VKTVDIRNRNLNTYSTRCYLLAS